MSKRIDILDSLYAHLSSVVGDTYSPLKSEGNGSIAFYDTINGAVVHFAIQLEEKTTQGQALDFLSAPLHLTAYKRFSLPILPSESDYEKEKTKSDMIEELRKAYAFTTPAMCAAGVNTLDYIRELEPNRAQGDIVAIKMEFTIKWYDGR